MCVCVCWFVRTHTPHGSDVISEVTNTRTCVHMWSPAREVSLSLSGWARRQGGRERGQDVIMCLTDWHAGTGREDGTDYESGATGRPPSSWCLLFLVPV